MSVFRDPSRLRVALPNKGRLREPTLALLSKAGYAFRAKDRALYATCTNAEILFIFVRTEDVPVLVGQGVVDCGITGQDLVVERRATVKEVLPLGYGRCRLSLAVSDSAVPSSLAGLAGATIATSFPNTTADFFAAEKVPVKIIEMNGGVEVMIALGLAQGIVDLVETGDSLKDNQLVVYKDLSRTETVLVAHPDKAADPRVQAMKRRVEGILIAERWSMVEYVVPRDRLKEAEAVTPGFHSPTLASLEDPDWVAVKVMVEKAKVAEAMDRLEAVGARAILETMIGNCRL